MTHVPQIFYSAINAYFILVRKKSSVLSQSELVLVLVSLTLDTQLHTRVDVAVKPPSKYSEKQQPGLKCATQVHRIRHQIKRSVLTLISRPPILRKKNPQILGNDNSVQNSTTEHADLNKTHTSMILGQTKSSVLSQ